MQKYKAIKNFSVNGNEYNVGGSIKKADVEDRLIRGRKIEEVQSKKVQKAPKPKKVEVLTEVVKVEDEGELLTDDSSKVEIIKEINESDDKEELEDLGREHDYEVDRRKSLETIKNNLKAALDT